MSRVVAKNTESHHMYVAEIEPTNGNGVPVLLLPSPEVGSVSEKRTGKEPLKFHDQWAALERFGSQSMTLTQAGILRLAAFITACASSPLWRTTGLAIAQSVSSGVTLLSQAGAVVAESLSALPWGKIWLVAKKTLKLGISMFLDFLDFTIGRLLGFGILFDIGCACMCAALWGKRGWWALWEVIDITEQIDGFIPTCTIIALRSWNDE